MRIWGGTISLGKHVRVVNSSEVRIFLQISWQFFSLCSEWERQQLMKSNVKYDSRYRSHTHQRALSPERQMLSKIINIYLPGKTPERILKVPNTYMRALYNRPAWFSEGHLSMCWTIQLKASLPLLHDFAALYMWVYKDGKAILKTSSFQNKATH